MFANFFGIVIISVSALLIVGLTLRPTPDLPATMNLGLVDNLASTTSQTAPASSPKSANVVSDTDGTDTSAATNTEDSPASTQNIAPAKVDATLNTATQNTKPAATSSGLSKEYLEIRRRAIENSEASHTRVNKSDGINYKDQ